MQKKLVYRMLYMMCALLVVLPVIAQEGAVEEPFPAIVIEVSGTAFVQRVNAPASIQEPVASNTYIYPGDLIFIPQGQITILCPNSLDELEIRSPGGATQCEGGTGDLRPPVQRNSNIAVDTSIPYLIFPRNEYFVASNAAEINVLWAPVEGANRYTVGLEYRAQPGSGGWTSELVEEVTENTLTFTPRVGEYRATILAYTDSSYLSTNEGIQAEIDRTFSVLDSAMVNTVFVEGLGRVPNDPPVLAWYYHQYNFSANALEQLQAALPLDLRTLSTKDTTEFSVADLSKRDLDQFEFLGRVLRDNNLRQEANVVFRLTHRIANDLDLPLTAASALESLSTVAATPDETFCFLGAAISIYQAIDFTQRADELLQAQTSLGIGVPQCGDILAGL